MRDAALDGDRWSFSSYQTIENVGGDNVLRSDGTDSDYSAQFERLSTVRSGDDFELEFEVNSFDPAAFFYVFTTVDGVEYKWGAGYWEDAIITYTNIGGNISYSYNNPLLDNVSPNRRYVLKVQLDDASGFSIEAYDKANPLQQGSRQTLQMPAGAEWTVRHVLWRDRSYVDNYQERTRSITAFDYDAGGQRVATVEQNGSGDTLQTTYYPFPGYEETVTSDGASVTTRATYSLDGRPVAVQVSGSQNASENGLFYLYTDHLGSNTAITDDSGSLTESAMFLPFGGYRNQPSDAVTDRGFTGHRHNADVGLIYMNARFYLPYINRFISADTIVPDPANPQSLNRYSYGYNNPINLRDKTGHSPEYNDEFNSIVNEVTSFLKEGNITIWWGAGKNYIRINGYGLVDPTHLSAAFNVAELLFADIWSVVNGITNIVRVADSGFVRWYGVNPELFAGLSGDELNDMMTRTVYGIFQDFYEQFEREQLPLLSSWSPEDLPSNHLGFMAYALYGHLGKRRAIAYTLAFIAQGDADNIDVPVKCLARPAPFSDNRGWSPIRWCHGLPGCARTEWPTWLEVAPVRSGPETWWRLR